MNGSDGEGVEKTVREEGGRKGGRKEGKKGGRVILTAGSGLEPGTYCTVGEKSVAACHGGGFDKHLCGYLGRLGSCTIMRLCVFEIFSSEI